MLSPCLFSRTLRASVGRGSAVRRLGGAGEGEGAKGH